MATHAAVLSILIVLSLLAKPIQSSSEGNLTCESSTINQYKCSWKFYPRYKNETYEIKSKDIRFDGNDGSIGEISPVDISSKPKEYQTIYHYDYNEGGILTEQVVSVNRITSSGKVQVSSLTFTPYTQAIPNKVTNFKLEVTETYIRAAWQRPYDLQNSIRDLLYKLRYWNHDIGKTQEMGTEEHLITGLSPHTTYNVSLACRFKLKAFDDEAKWGEETIIAVTTLGLTTPPPTESLEWVYTVIGLFIGMVFVIVIIAFIIQIKRRYMVLDLKNTTQIYSNILKWKDLRYSSVTKEKEQYNVLREPQTTEPSPDLGNVSNSRELQEDGDYISKSNDQDLYKPISFTNVDRSQQIDLPTSTESNASKSFLFESYVKIGDGYKDDEDLHVTSTPEDKNNSLDMNNENGYINRDNKKIEYGYIPT